MDGVLPMRGQCGRRKICFYQFVVFDFNSLCVLGSARTGLIFTSIQEGTQPGGLTPPGQTEQGIPYHVPSCWVPVGGSRRRELSCGSGARSGGGWWEWLCLFLLFVLCILLISIIVVPVPFVCCSVKLPLSRPTSFCLFLSILLRTPAEGGAAAWRFSCWPQPNYNTVLMVHCLPTCYQLVAPVHRLDFPNSPSISCITAWEVNVARRNTPYIQSQQFTVSLIEVLTV